MRRPILVYVLITAVFMAASGLAYYGYSYSRQLSVRERAVILDTMRELAEEKVIGIENELIESDVAVFNRIEISNISKLKDILEWERPAIESVVVLGENLEIVPGGFFSKRSREKAESFKKMLLDEVLPDLGLRAAKLDTRGHLHTIHDGRPYLFSFMRRASQGRIFYVVLEADLVYLVSSVFPQFFGVRSPRLYQVVDSAEDVVYGFDFAQDASGNVVEMGFPETVSRWRLRVAQRKKDAVDTHRPRQIVDLVLIGSALVVIFTGLVVLLMGLRRERRANALKSEFISNVSHELKTPLSIISMFGEMLALGRTRSTEQATEYAEIIWKESVRLARLIDNVLDFAKIERGAEVYEFAEGDVGEVVGRAVELSSRRLQGADLEVSVEIPDDLPLLSIDSNALTLAALNLVDNAIKYASSGKRIEISVAHVDGKPGRAETWRGQGSRRSEPTGERVEIRVRDYGPGIPAEERGRIFERFYRARSVRLKPVRGSGIGLALVKHIAQAHGGDVVLDRGTDNPADNPEHLDAQEPSVDPAESAGEAEPGSGPGAAFRLWIPMSPRR